LDISVIIVNYNVKEFIQNLVHSIYKSAGNLSYEIIIVDNASSDGSVELITSLFPEIKLIANKENLGFGKANNLGIKEAKGDYLLFLNPDTIVREDTFIKMLEFFRNVPDAGLAGCRILNPDGTLQLACRRSFPGPWTSFCKVTGLSTLFPHSRIFARYNLTYLDENKTYEVDAVSGSFMMMKREVYEKIGGFDEQFFMYGEDLDLCYRVQKAGYKVYYVHTTEIIHYKGESTKRSSLDETKFFYDAMHLFVRKHLSSSFIVEIILQTAIVFRKFFAFLGKRRLIVLSMLLDFIFFNLSLFAAEKFYGTIRDWQGFPEEDILLIYTLPALLQVLMSAFLRVYKKDSLSVLKNFGSVFAGFVLVSALTFFFKQYAFSRAVVIITYIFFFVVSALWRIIVKLTAKRGTSEDPFSNRRTLIVGIKSQAVEISRKLASRHAVVYNVIGFISPGGKEIGSQINDLKVLGSIENINKVIKEYRVNEVIFSPEEISYKEIMAVVSSSQEENVDFKIVGYNLDFLVGKASVSILDDVPLIEINYNVSRISNRILKGIFDFTLALFALFFIYPFIYLSAPEAKKRTDFQKFILNIPSVLTRKRSFVGPAEKNQSNLYLGKQGLTGLWYIDNFEEGEPDKLDIYYAKNQDIWLDLEIIGKTLNKMWTKKK
jgi:O-antigen biosynthesis protein